MRVAALCAGLPGVPRQGWGGAGDAAVASMAGHAATPRGGPVRQAGGAVRGLAAAGAGVLALALGTATPACAAVRYGIDGTALAARIDNGPLYTFAVDTLWRQARLADPGATRAATLETLVGERLLAARARALWGEAALLTGQGVGYLHEVALDDQLAALLRNLYRQELEQALAQAGGLDGLAGAEPPVSPAVLDTVLGKPGALRLDYSLAPAQAELARTVPVLVYHVPGREAATLSLYDVYRRQNVQGRAALHTRQPGALRQQARQALGVLVTLDWARARFGAAALADLRGALSDQMVAAAVQRLHGIGADTDSGSALLDQLAAQATPEAVRAYYEQHRDEFRRIEKVKARHIRAADEAAAQAACAALRGGAEFASVARQYSTAADAMRGGDLGWITHTDKAADQPADKASGKEQGKASGQEPGKEPGKASGKDLGKDTGKDPGKDPGRGMARESFRESVRETAGSPEMDAWLQHLAFTQPPGQLSRPVRAPAGPHDKAGWEIVLVEQRVEGVQPPDAESVRYAASRAIARSTALAQLAALRARVVREADIELNRSLLDAPLRTLEAAP